MDNFGLAWMAATLFLAGACVGSFLNVCIYRIPAGQSLLFPGSRCPHCRTPVPFYLNIPVLSYLILKGRCRFCQGPIAIRYPAVEALTGGLALACFYRFGPGLPGLFWFIFGATLITVTFIDIDHQIIPDRITLPGILFFTLSSVWIPGMSLKASLLGILTGGGIPYALALAYYFVRREQGLGGGDIKLLAMIGAATGVAGVIFTLFLGSLTGTVYGIGASIARKGKDRLKIPFGPFLAFGALVYIFAGGAIIRWYLGVISGS